MEANDFPTGVFAEWQPVYAEHNIATFPCRPDKRPAVTNYGRFGLPASRTLAFRSGADAFGFVCGKRSGITVLDWDSTDERGFADALNRHGQTPIMVRSGSGHLQAWYRHAGERRLIRPRREVPLDILGGGYVVAPPSRASVANINFLRARSTTSAIFQGCMMRRQLSRTADIWARSSRGSGISDYLVSALRRPGTPMTSTPCAMSPEPIVANSWNHWRTTR